MTGRVCCLSGGGGGLDLHGGGCWGLCEGLEEGGHHQHEGLAELAERGDRGVQMGSELVDASPVEAGLGMSRQQNYLEVLVHAGEKDPQIPAEPSEPLDLLAGREQTRPNELLRVFLALLSVLRLTDRINAVF